jgi:hypothetical protein
MFFRRPPRSLCLEDSAYPVDVPQEADRSPPAIRPSRIHHLMSAGTPVGTSDVRPVALALYKWKLARPNSCGAEPWCKGWHNGNTRTNESSALSDRREGRDAGSHEGDESVRGGRLGSVQRPPRPAGVDCPPQAGDSGAGHRGLRGSGRFRGPRIGHTPQGRTGGNSFGTGGGEPT